ncbi:glycine receptor subunit alpha-3-like [Oppia nitens]|uniref:glycine receptor subunit alpha-3-like n=1 Tax=Oppia nitens TaxID=1686743 RepID=UPI0023DB5393|nr:glycine receptor subunit alpha-3-like [Oppia nitens]
MASIVSCPMDFHKHPKETFNCRLKFRSYTYPLTKVIYKWHIPTPIALHPRLKLSKHKLDISYQSFNISTFEGYFSIIQVTFTFKEMIANKLFHVYLPSFIIVFLSWLSFWISSDTLPARVALCVMCLLAISAQSVGVRQELPRVSYITLVDIWLLGCLMFIFGSLFEYTIVKYIEAVHEKHLKDICDKNDSQTPKIQENNENNVSLTNSTYYTTPYYPLVCSLVFD